MNHKEGIEAYVAGATNKLCDRYRQSVRSLCIGDRTEELKILLERFMKRPDLEEIYSRYSKGADRDYRYPVGVFIAFTDR